MEHVVNRICEFKKTRVIAYSGYKANERPICFLMGGVRSAVKEIRARWSEEHDDHFKVVAEDGYEYHLKWHRTLDEWVVKRC